MARVSGTLACTYRRSISHLLGLFVLRLVDIDALAGRATFIDMPTVPSPREQLLPAGPDVIGSPVIKTVERTLLEQDRVGVAGE